VKLDFSWMAWTAPTATFFGVIAALIAGMAVWERLSPGGGPRQGILGLNTHRGDRLFISLLGSAFIHIAWLGLTDLSLWIATGISVVYAGLVFRFV
jgi:predicted small integral membrane protein